MLELGRRIAAACGAEFDPEIAAPRLGEIRRTAIDPGRAERELGWRAERGLESGLELTVDSMR